MNNSTPTLPLSGEGVNNEVAYQQLAPPPWQGGDREGIDKHELYKGWLFKGG